MWGCVGMILPLIFCFPCFLSLLVLMFLISCWTSALPLPMIFLASQLFSSCFLFHMLLTASAWSPTTSTFNYCHCSQLVEHFPLLCFQHWAAGNNLLLLPPFPLSFLHSLSSPSGMEKSADVCLFHQAVNSLFCFTCGN